MNVLLLNPISDEAVDFIRSNHVLITPSEGDSDDSLIKDRTEVVIARSGPVLDRKFLESLPRLCAVIRPGTGTDNIDTDYLSSKSIPLYLVINQHANSVAELTFGLMVSLARSITQYNSSMRDGLWEKGKKFSIEVRGKVIGIVGLGNIGSRLAKLSSGWDVKILGCVQNYSDERRERLLNQGIELVRSLNELAEKADFVVVVLPLNDSTRSIINGEFISRMKKTALFVNVGRADTIDEEALFNALRTKSIAGAALDVHKHQGVSKFSTLENVILTPHIGSSTKDAQIAIGQEVIKHLQTIENTLNKRERV
jgi:D-3-phosphoglycerate dehydrogenase